MGSEYIAVSQSLSKLIAIRAILRKITIFRTHFKAFTLSTIPQSTVHEHNEVYLKFATMPKMASKNKAHWLTL